MTSRSLVEPCDKPQRGFSPSSNRDPVILSRRLNHCLFPLAEQLTSFTQRYRVLASLPLGPFANFRAA